MITIPQPIVGVKSPITVPSVTAVVSSTIPAGTMLGFSSVGMEPLSTSTAQDTPFFMIGTWQKSLI